MCNYLDRLGLLRPIHYGLGLALRSPSQLFTEISADWRLDRAHDNKETRPILCVGLPKSGTTLIETVLGLLGAINARKSIFRRTSYLPKNEHEHGISDGYFCHLPKNKLSFLKTHTHYDKKYAQIIYRYKVNCFVSIRDLRSMMFSRYHHVMSDRNHWQHQEIISLPIKEGFLRSWYGTARFPEHPISYYAEWISGYLEQCFPIVRYETFLTDPEKYIEQIARFSGLKVDYMLIKQIIVQMRTSNLENNVPSTLGKNLTLPGRRQSTFRGGKPEDWRSVFSPSISKRFKAETGDLLVRSGYEKSNCW